MIFAVEEKGESMNDLISRQAAIDALTGMIDRFERILADIRESKGDDTVCGMCEYDGAYIGQSGDWCNECPGFDKDDCFKLSDKCRKRWMGDITLPSAQPESKYTVEELKAFRHGISLRLLSLRSAQHWSFDEETEKEIDFLERLHKKVSEDINHERPD